MTTAVKKEKPFRFKAKDVVEAYRSRGLKASRYTYCDADTARCCLLAIGYAAQKAIRRAETLQRHMYAPENLYRLEDYMKDNDSRYMDAAETGFMASEDCIPDWYDSRQLQGWRDGRAAWKACEKAGLTE